VVVRHPNRAPCPRPPSAIFALAVRLRFRLRFAQRFARETSPLVVPRIGALAPGAADADADGPPTGTGIMRGGRSGRHLGRGPVGKRGSPKPPRCGLDFPLAPCTTITCSSMCVQAPTRTYVPTIPANSGMVCASRAKLFHATLARLVGLNPGRVEHTPTYGAIPGSREASHGLRVSPTPFAARPAQRETSAVICPVRTNARVVRGPLDHWTYWGPAPSSRRPSHC
jgi:hypothetical protein